MPLEQILPYAIVPGVPGVYVCGCLERWVSIYLQALRGLNLAWALSRTGRVAPGARVCVVGGGFAGLAAAAGLGRVGADVTLLEGHGELCATQRQNRVRAIHPHIHEWPRPIAQKERAGLPILDWTAGLAADVAAEVLRAFDAERARSGIVVQTGALPVALADGPAVSWCGGPAERFDAVVLALGVGVEKSFGALPLASYWGDASINQVQEGPRRHHLVTGIGEGGVIDALYLRLRDFSHAAVAAALAGVEGMRAVCEALLAIEAEIEQGTDEEANRTLGPWYAALPVPAEADAVLAARLRPDTRVTLNGPEPSPLAARADILNRFLVSRLIATGEMTYLPGKITDLAPVGDGYEAQLADGTRHTFDRVNVRHGTVAALKAGFPEIWERYQPVRGALPHLTPEPEWPAGFWDGG